MMEQGLERIFRIPTPPGMGAMNNVGFGLQYELQRRDAGVNIDTFPDRTGAP